MTDTASSSHLSDWRRLCGETDGKSSGGVCGQRDLPRPDLAKHQHTPAHNGLHASTHTRQKKHRARILVFHVLSPAVSWPKWDFCTDNKSVIFCQSLQKNKRSLGCEDGQENHRNISSPSSFLSFVVSEVHLIRLESKRSFKLLTT